MGRWDISDDARSLEPTSDRTPERTETIHHDHGSRITPLPDLSRRDSKTNSVRVANTA